MRDFCAAPNTASCAGCLREIRAQAYGCRRRAGVASRPCGTAPLSGTARSEEIPMNSNWIEEGWRRFLDRLKELWGKRTNPDPVIQTN